MLISLQFAEFSLNLGFYSHEVEHRIYEFRFEWDLDRPSSSSVKTHGPSEAQLTLKCNWKNVLKIYVFKRQHSINNVNLLIPKSTCDR